MDIGVPPGAVGAAPGRVMVSRVPHATEPCLRYTMLLYKNWFLFATSDSIAAFIVRHFLPFRKLRGVKCGYAYLHPVLGFPQMHTAAFGLL